MQKCIKLKIIKPFQDDSTWKDLGDTLRDLSYACYRASNFVVRERYMNALKKLENKDFKDKCYCYPALTEMFPNVAGHILNAAERGAAAKWSSHAKAVLRSEESLINFKRNMPIYIHNRAYKLLFNETPDENGYTNYYVDAQLCSKNTEKTRYKFIVSARDRGTVTILNRIISGEYVQGEGQISYDQRRKIWYMIIPYKFEADPNFHDLDPDKIMGIDLGVVKAVYFAYNDSLKRGCIDGKEIEKFRRTVRARRISMLNQYPYSGRKGHGVSRALLPTDVLSERESNFRNTCNFRYANYVVMQALKNKCGTIQMENLSDITKYTSSKFLKNWSYYDLQTKIINKAAEYGIKVVVIDPQYTSQRCSCCGHISKENRPDQATFICESCGYGSHYVCKDCGHVQEDGGVCNECGGSTTIHHVNADFNAARNIATNGIEEIIADKLEELGIKAKPKKKKRAV